ncbi:unnamed protein product [Orchesella dallaii]|uniref:Uncharacterized protein n=1 Tax=Orchesella dallaii TaxID=48710 RepID=A0ABP1QCX9_9HEXA
MASFTGLRVFLLVAVIVTLSAIPTSGLHCYHCVHDRNFVYNGSETEIHDYLERSSSIIRRHPSCAYGEEPDSSLSVECNADHLAVAVSMFHKNNTDLDKYENLEYKMDQLMTKTHGVRYACMAILARGPEIQILDDVSIQLQSTFRTCIPDHLDFKQQLELLSLTGFEGANITGYTCDSVNNCNGKGDAESHRSSQSPPENLAESKATYMSLSL